jgi:hypothetical protein
MRTKSLTSDGFHHDNALETNGKTDGPPPPEGVVIRLKIPSSKKCLDRKTAG